MRNNYFFVSYEKENIDSTILISKIASSSWLQRDTILVNCSPDYTSRLIQLMNHKLSYLNNNELFEVIDLEMPYPTMYQIWDGEEKVYKTYGNYLLSWVQKHLKKSNNYLFVDSATCRGNNFTTLKSIINGKIENENYRFASIYLQDNSIFTPDFYVEKFNKSTQGGILFEWENINNPNWDY